MQISPLQRMRIIQSAERVLHASCNRSKAFTEMTIVLDYNMDCESIKEVVKTLIVVLKSHGEQFRNVRCNVVHWIGTKEIQSKITPAAMLQLDGFFENYKQIESVKVFEELTEYLKLYHARSSIVWIVTNEKYKIVDNVQLQRTLHPFLNSKIIFYDDNHIELGIQKKYD